LIVPTASVADTIGPDPDAVPRTIEARHADRGAA
jgi:hypothetical protein